ncbi:MAG: diguanylate cyclase [Deltaproteobacteria bacterium]|nr:diguanylate cyclase [Candidatus Anaeroferrophillacea bacterium]
MDILIAEDELVSRNILTALLKRFGHRVTAADGSEALAVMSREGAPRLAILYWMMPGMDGVDVCRRIRTVPSADPPYVILLTARNDERSIVEGLDAGANDYLTKPYGSEELRARVGVGVRMLELQADLGRIRNDLAHEAMHDSLTGILNRRAIPDGLSRELSRAGRQGSTLTIGLYDIDSFKQINDRYGHLTGDDVLRKLTAILRDNLRDYDLIGRYGGEEFLVVGPRTDCHAPNNLYERLRHAAAASPIPTRSGDLSITISIGTAGASGDEDPDTILAAADNALYEAKRTGRNRVVCATAKGS